MIIQERRKGHIQMISLISIDDGNISHNRSADVHDEEEDGAQVQKLTRQRADKKEQQKKEKSKQNSING